jgi:hypothetical protein
VKLEFIALDEFIANLQGDTKKHLEALMCQLGEAEDLLEEKERFEREAPMNFFPWLKILRKNKGSEVLLKKVLLDLKSLTT